MTCPAALALVTGGYNADQSVEIYSSEGSCNRHLPDLPDKRYVHTVNFVDGILLLCGGGSSITRTSCLEMDKDFTMVPHSTTTVERGWHSSVVMGGQLTLLGGEYPSYNSTEFIYPRFSGSWSQGYNLIEETVEACAVKLTWDTFLVTGGGYNTHVVLYNNTDGTGRRLQDLNYGRQKHGCTLVQNETYTGVMVAGGWTGSDTLSSTEVMDIAEGTWQMAGNLNTGRDGLRILVLEDKIVAMGGFHGGGSYLSSVEQFDVSTLTWSDTTELLTARSFHAVTTLPVTRIDCGND